MVVSMFPNIQHLSFIKKNSKKLHRLASTASDREGTKYQWKFGFFMINSTKRGLYWSFWCQGWSDHQFCTLKKNQNNYYVIFQKFDTHQIAFLMTCQRQKNQYFNFQDYKNLTLFSTFGMRSHCSNQDDPTTILTFGRDFFFTSAVASRIDFSFSSMFSSFVQLWSRSSYITGIKIPFPVVQPAAWNRRFTDSPQCSMATAYLNKMKTWWQILPQHQSTQYTPNISDQNLLWKISLNVSVVK